MAKVIPPGAYQPGTALTVGRHNVTIKAYISEGGFAHVYTVNVTAAPPGDDYFRSVVANNDKARSQTDISGNPNKSNSSTPSSSETSIPFTPYVACLKRVAVPDKTSLNLLRGEVEAMQRLKGQKYIVRYIDSHAARASAPNTGYEVFLLMEYCSGNGLIDFMNTRLRDQLKEHEVLKIMYDISQGVAAMHYLTPSLIHRDLKIENVLIADDGTYKLCDFGSVSPILRPPRNQQEFAILDNDIQRHTTVQYRAPEMVDIYRGFPIDEKSDIWALGVFLYKLCYYTTPFEQQGQLAILNATFTFPNHPIFSDRMKRLISILLREDPRARPNIYQVVEEVSRMRNVPVPIKDIYSVQPKAQQQAPPSSTQLLAQQQILLAKQQAEAQQAKLAAHAQAQALAEQAAISKTPKSTVNPIHRGRVAPSSSASSTPLTPTSSTVSPNDSISKAKPPVVPPRSSIKLESSETSSPSLSRASPQLISEKASAKGPTPSYSTPDQINVDDISERYPTVEELTSRLEQQSLNAFASSGSGLNSPSLSSRTNNVAPIKRTPIPTANTKHSLFDLGPKKPSPTSAELVSKKAAMNVHSLSVATSMPSSGPVSRSPTKEQMVSHSTMTDDPFEFSPPKPRQSVAQQPNLKNKISLSVPPRISRTPSITVNGTPSREGSLSASPRKTSNTRPNSIYGMSSTSLTSSSRVTSYGQDAANPGSMPGKNLNAGNSGSLTPNYMDDTLEDRAGLQKLLTGVGEHSQTVVLEDSDRHHISSNLDFLKSLDKDNTGRSIGSKIKRQHSHTQARSISRHSTGCGGDDNKNSGNIHLLGEPVYDKLDKEIDPNQFEYYDDITMTLSGSNSISSLGPSSSNAPISTDYEFNQDFGSPVGSTDSTMTRLSSATIIDSPTGKSAVVSQGTTMGKRGHHRKTSSFSMLKNSISTKFNDTLKRLDSASSDLADHDYGNGRASRPSSRASMSSVNGTNGGTDSVYQFPNQSRTGSSSSVVDLNLQRTLSYSTRRSVSNESNSSRSSLSSDRGNIYERDEPVYSMKTISANLPNTNNNGTNIKTIGTTSLKHNASPSSVGGPSKSSKTPDRSMSQNKKRLSLFSKHSRSESKSVSSEPSLDSPKNYTPQLVSRSKSAASRSIQGRISALMSGEPVPAKRTATGYGKYTEDELEQQQQHKQREKEVAAYSSGKVTPKPAPKRPAKPQVLQSPKEKERDTQRNKDNDYMFDFSQRYPSIF